MIRKYTFGTPLPTDAVVKPLPPQAGPVPFFDVRTGADGSLSFSLSLDPEEVIFGLGQAVRGVDKRGFRFESWNSDVFNHTESQPSLYGSHNFIVFFGPKRLLGLFLGSVLAASIVPFSSDVLYVAILAGAAAVIIILVIRRKHR